MSTSKRAGISRTTRDDMSIEERVGLSLSRSLFAVRGNHSRVHLSEAELTEICRAAARLTIDLLKVAA